MRNVDITAPGKLYGLLLTVVGCFALLIVIVIKGDGGSETIALMSPVVALLTLLIGYLVANGTGATKGIVSVPPFQPKPHRQLEYLASIAEEDLPFKERDRIERLVQRTKEVEADG